MNTVYTYIVGVEPTVRLSITSSSIFYLRTKPVGGKKQNACGSVLLDSKNARVFYSNTREEIDGCSGCEATKQRGTHHATRGPLARKQRSNHRFARACLNNPASYMGHNFIIFAVWYCRCRSCRELKQASF